MSARLLLAGYFGCGNFGDDAILMGFIEGIRQDGHAFSVMAKNPERMFHTYGMTAIPRFDNSQVKGAIEECDALVFPGGSIFQDVTSVRSVMYYANLVKMAKKAKKKVILLGQGVGPLNTYLGKQFAVGAFNSADAIVVRDPQSAATLRSLGVRVNPKLGADMAFLLPEPDVSSESQSFSAGGMKSIGISVRPFGKDKKALIQVFADLSRLLYENKYVPLMFAMDEAEDQPLIQEISKAQGGKVPELKGIGGPVILQQRIARLEAVIAMRLHAGILAATVNVPAFMIAYDPKVTAFANAMGFPTPPSMQGLTGQRIFDDFQNFIKTRERTVESIRRRRPEFAKQAQVSIDVLREVLG